MTKNFYHVIFLLGDIMISRMILEDVIDEMIEDVCYVKLKAMITHSKNKGKN